MMKTLPILIVATLCLFLTPSCSKKSTNSTPACKIITITDQIGTATPTTYNLTYDNNGRISTEQFTNGTNSTTRVFTYLGNTVIVAATAGTSTSRDSITLTSDGLIASDYYSNSSGSNANTIYTYSGSQVEKSILTQDGNAPVTTTYTWTSGDLTSSSSPATNNTYTYNTKASETGDYWQIIQLITYGVDFVKAAHQLTGYQVGTSLENINYTYDSTGKITAITGTEGSMTENITYQYQCN